MRIRRVQLAGLRGATPPGGWSNEISPEDSIHTLVAVHTDEGHVGIGSIFTHEDLARGALSVLSDLLIGEELISPRHLTERLHQHTFWMGRGGAITHTISGINIALWDIMGQALDRPIGHLLGGSYRRSVTPYASLLMDDSGQMTEQLEALVADGFSAFKIGWGPFGRVDARTDERLVAVAREAVGPDAVLAVDAGGSDAHWPNGYKWAIDAAHMLSDFDVAWFEEPLRPDDLQGFARLTLMSPVKISGGETLTRRQSFAPFIDQAAFDIVQPDVTKVGGLNESMAIGERAEDASIRLLPHGWNTAVGLAADLHLAAALPSTDLVEYCTGSHYIDDLVDGGWERDPNGRLEVPQGAGLGVVWDRDAIDRFTGPGDLFDP